MSDIQKLTELVIAFRDARDWKQFHTPKDCALSLSLEASEVLEHFQWKNGAEVSEYIVAHREDIAEELADVLNWVLIMAHDLGIDIVDACERKNIKNIAKYPVEKSRGRAVKYTEL